MKQINLAEWAIKHKQIVYFFIFFILLGGIMSYFSLGRSEDPAFTIREAVVTAAWPGASAEQITEQVTDPLEKTLQDVKGLDYLRSFTHDGKTVIYVDLKDDVPKEDIQTRWHEMRNLVEDEWRSLPAGVVGPFIDDRFDDVYGSIYAVTGDDFSYEEKENTLKNPPPSDVRGRRAEGRASWRAGTEYLHRDGPEQARYVRLEPDGCIHNDFPTVRDDALGHDPYVHKKCGHPRRRASWKR